ncbi:hypothetical protein D6779_10590 [Candidatus Parcubacteria bacterium]|nr:MAG: hypothetical protein D6779_10590 [Candidatus Parcubacteria bacterium]
MDAYINHFETTVQSVTQTPNGYDITYIPPASTFGTIAPMLSEAYFPESGVSLTIQAINAVANTITIPTSNFTPSAGETLIVRTARDLLSTILAQRGGGGGLGFALPVYINGQPQYVQIVVV